MLLLAACISTKLLTSWHKPDYAAMIISLVENKEQERYVPPTFDCMSSYGMG